MPNLIRRTMSIKQEKDFENLQTTAKNAEEIINQQNKVIRSVIQFPEITDKQAVTFKSMYPYWEDVIGQTVKKGFKFQYEDILYKVIQESMTIQEQWIPGQGTSAIYSQIVEESDSGTKDNPIPVPEDVTSNSFTYIVGKYYMEDGVIYKCEKMGDEDGKEYSFPYKPSQLLNQYFVISE